MPKDRKPPPKLPKQQLTILAIARFAEPLAHTSVFPYLPEMIRDFGISQNEIAKWAGFTSAVFSISQSITAIPWGRAADRYGRKPILVLGLLCTMVCFVAWGMSASLTMAIVVRAVQGGSNGNVGIIRTMVAEMVPEKELQPRAFSIMPLVWSLGSVVGPSFGGFFAQPAKQYPSIFAGVAFFERFPYALPNLVATVFFFVSVTSTVLFLRETLESKKDRPDWGLLVGERISRAFRRRSRRRPTLKRPAQRRRSFVDGEATAPLIPSKVSRSPKQSQDDGPPALKEVITTQTTINLVAYTFLAFHSVAWDQNVTVFLNYPRLNRKPEDVKLPFYFTGGFGLNSGEIGTIFTLYGLACGIIQFLLYSPLVTKFGVHYCLKVCSVVLPLAYFFTPYTTLFEDTATRYSALFVIMLIKAFCIIIAFPSTTILLTNSCPSLRVLAVLNGFATTFSALGRAFGPALTGLIFSRGAKQGVIGSAYFFLAAVAAVGAIPVFMIREGDGPTASSSAPSSTSSSATSSDSEDDEDAEGGSEDHLDRSAMLLSEESTVLGSDEELTSQSEPLIPNSTGSKHGYNTMKAT